ncbi:hypothetical protein XU18_3482 [Perkinsela sp. CCAP 1560/4]|nr:hypothetical protein XU18_3482 [Perkinsela sp. CCAP 1560/4]|eukprot:KNH05511.1 hypothetical protein XU18_3482 [Perkinsela sp. CCAP 1560/4]
MFLLYTQFSLIYTKLSEIITTVLFACGDDAIGKFDRSTLPRQSLMDILFLGLSRLKTAGPMEGPSWWVGPVPIHGEVQEAAVRCYGGSRTLLVARRDNVNYFFMV